jgi:hypothetical protein
MPSSGFTVDLDQVIAMSLKNPTDKFISIVEGQGSEARFVRIESGFGPMFAIQKWHKLYAGALIETDSVRLSRCIVLAEAALLDRYLKLIATKSDSDEFLDLQNAIAVLSGLREVNLISRMASEVVV